VQQSCKLKNTGLQTKDRPAIIFIKLDAVEKIKMEPPGNSPLFGKTYSLFGEGFSTREFYHSIARLADDCLRTSSLPAEELLNSVQAWSMNKRKLKSLARREQDPSLSGLVLNCLHSGLNSYLGDVEGHLRSVPLNLRLTDRELLTSREQYLLYMLEIELTNRLHRREFAGCTFKIALLPYCLKESHHSCKAAPDEFENQCRGCLKTCPVNRLGKILRDHGVEPYILSRGRVNTLLKSLKEKHGSLGVLGIACLVELVMGMRLCRKGGLPVVGIPLNANRCPRWMGSMHETSVDFQALENLITGESTNLLRMAY
jgi:hypothetical protein